jgi:hypothetical protein
MNVSGINRFIIVDFSMASGCWFLQVRLVKMQQDLEEVVHHLQAPREAESLALAQAREKRVDTFLDVQEDLERALLHLDPRYGKEPTACVRECLVEACLVLHNRSCTAQLHLASR